MKIFHNCVESEKSSAIKNASAKQRRLNGRCIAVVARDKVSGVDRHQHHERHVPEPTRAPPGISRRTDDDGLTVDSLLESSESLAIE